MYKILNISQGKVILGDLNLLIDSGQEIDLDERFARDVIDASKDLVKAMNPKRRLLAVTHKDVPVEKAIDASVIEAMEKRLRRSIAKELANIQPQKDTSANDELKNKLDLIIAAISNGVPARSDAPSTQKEPETFDASVDDSKKIDIQTKLINRLARGVESKVETKAETKESDVGQKADELGGLLGD